MIKFQTETTDISRNIGIEMGKKQYGFTDIDRLIIELIGTIAFSISGAMVGIRRKMDIFGVLVLGVVTAVGAE